MASALPSRQSNLQFPSHPEHVAAFYESIIKACPFIQVWVDNERPEYERQLWERIFSLREHAFPHDAQNIADSCLEHTGKAPCHGCVSAWAQIPPAFNISTIGDEVPLEIADHGTSQSKACILNPSIWQVFCAAISTLVSAQFASFHAERVHPRSLSNFIDYAPPSWKLMAFIIGISVNDTIRGAKAVLVLCTINLIPVLDFESICGVEEEKG